MKLKNRLLGILSKLLTPSKEILDRLEEHIDLSINSLDKLIHMVTHPEEDISRLYRSIEENEKLGDKIVYNVTKKILQGAVSLTIQSHLIQLVNTLDDILDKINFLGRDYIRMHHYMKLHQGEVREILNSIGENLRHSMRILTKLKDMFGSFKKGDLDSILSMRDEIERLEEEGDEVKDKLIEKLYVNSRLLDAHQFILLRSYILDTDDIEDLCEDSANLISLIILSVLS